ncbi:MAG: hypothetical protein M3R04_10235, partial [bacterium]|nr:hypothetical protein [bacterium]
MPINVIILAGGELPHELQPVSDVRVKALLRIGEHTLLERTAHALAGSSMVGNIAVVGNDDVLRERPAHLAHVQAGSTIVENLYRGFMHHGGSLDDEFLVLSP